MPAFAYSAMDAAGNVKKGVLEGDTPRAIRQQIRDQGLTPLELEEVSQRESSSRSFLSRGPSMNAKDLALVTRQLATLVRSGLPIEEALKAVSEQTDSPRTTAIITGVRAKVVEGHSLATGLKDFPQAFSELYCTTVEAGEHSGHLDNVLERLADYTEDRQAMVQKVRTAMYYPTVLVVVAILMVSGLLVYVVPQVTRAFTNVGQELPSLTVGLINTSEFLQEHGLLMLSAIIMAYILFRWGLRNERFRHGWHGWILRFPFFGKLTRSSEAARFSRTFSILSASGVSVLEALRISAQVIGNLPIRAAVTEAAARVREGASISRSLRDTKQFPPMTLHLIASGEASGNLEEMLERAADNQDMEVQGMISVVLGMLGPIMILVMGIIVLVIMMAILLPIFEMNQLVI